MTETTQHQTRDPQEIREDIELTRERLGETVEALAQKSDVKAQARAKIDEAKARAKQVMPGSARQAASAAAVDAREHRKPLTLAGVALGAFLLGRATARR
jgi:hypothetical protein